MCKDELGECIQMKQVNFNLLAAEKFGIAYKEVKRNVSRFAMVLKIALMGLMSWNVLRKFSMIQLMKILGMEIMMMKIIVLGA